MGRIGKITSIPLLILAFHFVPVSPAQADQLAQSLKQVDDKPNPRFTIHDLGTPGEEGDGIVLDKKTGLIWPRNANLAGEPLPWKDVITYFHEEFVLADRKGW